MADPRTPIDVDALWARVLREQALRDAVAKEHLPANKAALFAPLAAAGVTTVIVTFDGAGDSGQIESIEARRDQEPVELPGVEVVIALPCHDGSGVEHCTAPLAEAVENFLYARLEETHAGWENNDGAYGEFRLDVANQTIELDYNMRIETSEYFGHSW